MSFLTANYAIQHIESDFLDSVTKIDVALPCETSLTIKSRDDHGSKRSFILGDAVHLVKLEVVGHTLFVRCDESQADQLVKVMLVLTLPSTKQVTIENACKKRLLSSLESKPEPNMIHLISRSDAGMSYVGMAKKARIDAFGKGYVSARNLNSQKIEVYIDDNSTASVNIQTDHQVVCSNYGLGRLFVHTSKKAAPSDYADRPANNVGVGRHVVVRL